MPALRLIVGLGNPGPAYARTRHNIGFRLVESLAGPEAAWKKFKDLGRYLLWNEILVAEPLTFMNESGAFVAPLCRYHHFKPSDILVCFDDISLEFGSVRLRKEGSSGGQKGMKSIIDALQTEGIPRLRLGIGPKPQGKDAADYVLHAFSAAEEKTIPALLEKGSNAISAVLAEGFEAAMTQFNRRAAP